MSEKINFRFKKTTIFLKNILLTIGFCTINIICAAQISLSGTITGINQTLKGASVYIADLKTGTVTNEDGTYLIKNIPNGIYLVEVSFIGFASQIKEVTIKGKSISDFNLDASSIESPEVIVTGVAVATDQHTTPAPISIISPNFLQETGFNNIIDALKYSPGVSQITQGPAISKPVIRGLGYNRVVVVNDGIRQEGQQFGDEFGIEADPYSINKIEILRGPASLSYGSDAMAGVINMLAAPTVPEGKIKGNIQSNFQTNNGLYGGSANIEGNINGITFDARYTHTDAHAYKNKNDGYVFNSGYGQNNFKGSAGINRNWGFSRITISSFNLKLGIVEGGRDPVTGQFNQHLMAADGTDSVAIVPDALLKSYTHNLIIHQNVKHYKAIWDNSFAIGNGRLGLRLGFQQNHRQEANDATLGNVYNIYYLLNTFNYDLRYTFTQKNNYVFSFGANGMQQASQNKGLLFLVPAYHLFDAGIFALINKTAGKFSLAGGVRFDNRSLHGDGLFLDDNGHKVEATSPNATERFKTYKTNFSGFSGSLGATVDFTKSFYGKINFSKAFRAPNIAESGSNGIHDGTPFYEIGDANLKPESSLQIDATLGVNTNNFSSELTLFRNSINNYIFPIKLASVFGGDSIRTDAMAAMSGPAFKYISGNALLYGAELTLNFHPQNIEWFHFDNTFSLIHAIQKNQAPATRYLPYTPPYKLVSGTEFIAKNLSKTFKNAYLRVDMEHCFKQDKIYYKFNNETITPAYTLVNIGVGSSVFSKGRTIFSIYLYAQNIADIAYQSNMSRLKYKDTNEVTGRIGVYEMGRNINFKVNIPLSFRN